MATKEKHPFHEFIAKEVENTIGDKVRFHRDMACGKCHICGCCHQLPLCYEKPLPKSKTELRLCMVDMLIYQGGKIGGIIEIEESDYGAVNVIGKLMASALATYYVPNSEKNSKIPLEGRKACPLSDSVIFIHVLGLPSRSSIHLYNRSNRIRDDIKNRISIARSTIKPSETYEMFFFYKEHPDVYIEWRDDREVSFAEFITTKFARRS